MTQPIPEGFHTVTPCLVFKDSRKAIEFYKKAFGAKMLSVLPGPDGQGTMHASLKIGNSVVMMADEMPGQPCKSPETLGLSPVSFYVYTEKVDALFNRALQAGATVVMPLQEMFWGDRAGQVQDPFGYRWMIASHTKDLTDPEIMKGAQGFCAGAGKK